MFNKTDQDFYFKLEGAIDYISAILGASYNYSFRNDFIEEINDLKSQNENEYLIECFKKFIIIDKLIKKEDNKIIEYIEEHFYDRDRRNEENIEYFQDLMKMFSDEMCNAGIISKKERKKLGNLGFTYYRDFVIDWFTGSFSTFMTSEHYKKPNQDVLMIEERFSIENRMDLIKEIYKSCIFMIDYPKVEWAYYVNERSLHNSFYKSCNDDVFKDFKTDKEAYEWFREMLKVFADLLLRRGIITKYEHAKAYKKPSMLNRIKNKIKEL